MAEIPYVRHPLEFPARYEHGPDSFPQPDVPHGELHEHEWGTSHVFPGTHRRYWVYVPALYSDSKPASLMVFQDARWYLDLEGEDRASVVFDNLIHRGEMPPTIGVFVEPGEPGRRNIEYDAFSDAYATLLLTEIPSGGSESLRDHGRSQSLGDRRWEQRRELCVHGRLDAARPFPTCLELRR